MDDIEQRVAVLELIVVETVPWLRDRTTEVRAMDDLEHRLVAIERIAGELVPWLDHRAIEDAMVSISVGLEANIDPDERVIRLAALQMLNEGPRRYDPPAVDMHWKAASGE